MNAKARNLLRIPGSKSRQIDQRRQEFVPRCISSGSAVYAATASGSEITDVDGNRLIDFTGGWGCMAVGHTSLEVVAAICDQARNFTHTDFSVVPYASYVDLAERLALLAPCPEPAQVALFNSGAEAIENAVKIARKHTDRRAIIVFSGAFHGRTHMAMTMTHQESPYKSGFGPFASEVYRASYPNPYRSDCRFQRFEDEVAAQVELSEVAAIVIEPIQGEGGFTVAPSEFLQSLRRYADQIGAMLVADEIQSGFGRTGKFFAVEHSKVSPDIITVGKSIAAGLPLSAVVASRSVFASLDSGALGGTYVGNPIACRAALEVLSTIERDGLLDRASHIGRIISKRFARMRGSYECIGDVRGVGAMLAMEFVRSKSSKEPYPELCAKVIAESLARGLVIAGAGYDKNVVRMLLPLTTPEELLLEGLDILEKSVDVAHGDV